MDTHFKSKVAAVILACGVVCNSIAVGATPVTAVAAVGTTIPAPVVAGKAIQARHVPDVVASGKAAALGAIDPQQRLRVALHLPLTHQDELTQLLQDLYDPNSPQFHKYLAVEEFTERFGATAADYNTVATWASAQGFTITSLVPNRRLVAVEGSVGTINRAFNVTMRSYQHPTEARTFFSPDREPTVTGLEVTLLQVTGMDNYVLPHPALQHSSTVVSSAGSGPGGEYLPSDMRAAYYGNGPLTGAGQSIGLFSFNGYLPSDVQLYYSSTGMSSTVPIVARLADGFNGACTTTGAPIGFTGACYDAEQTLDIVNAIGMAPGITQILFYEGAVGEDPQILNLMATDNTAKVISSSWSWSPADAASDDPIFMEFQAQGQTYLNATGDCGEYGGFCNTQETQPSYFFPGVDPYITEAGGTDLTTTGPGGTWVAETGWDQSGGGFVSGTGIPSWQQLAGVINSSNGGSTTLRNSPDVAAEANFDNPTVLNGQFMTGYGGTSFAAPRWAGFLTLANQQSVANGRGTVGFINPTIYALGTGASYSSLFHDVKSGSNPPLVGGGAGFNAVAGYDLVTGWGSPDGVALINALAGPPKMAGNRGAIIAIISRLLN
jgi:xanthomonalisin